MKIIDGDSSEAVERFPVTLIQQPTAFNHSNHIYDNILIFTVQHPDEPQGELHIFQCSSHSAQQIVDDLNLWMRRHGAQSQHLNNNHHKSNNHHKGGNHDDRSRSRSRNDDSSAPNSPSNINVKEAVHVFNAIAAQRETSKSTSPVAGHNSGRDSSNYRPVSDGHMASHHPRGDQGDSRSITTSSSIESGHNGATRLHAPHANGNSHDQVSLRRSLFHFNNHSLNFSHWRTKDMSPSWIIASMTSRGLLFGCNTQRLLFGNCSSGTTRDRGNMRVMVYWPFGPGVRPKKSSSKSSVNSSWHLTSWQNLRDVSTIPMRPN